MRITALTIARHPAREDVLVVVMDVQVLVREAVAQIAQTTVQVTVPRTAKAIALVTVRKPARGQVAF